MDHCVLFSLVVLFASSNFVSCDIFSSTAHLQHLLHLERHMIAVLHDYIDNTEKKLAYVRGYLENFYDSYSEVLAGNCSITGDEMVDNPLQAYHLVKRLSVDWDWLKNAMKVNNWKPVMQLTQTYEGLMPSSDDLNGAALALVRLQDTYRLNMAEMTKGDIKGIKSGIGLSARDLLYLGKQSFNEGYYAHCIRWLNQAVKQARKEGNTTASVPEIESFLQTAIEVHDELFDRKDIDLEIYDTIGKPIGFKNWENTNLDLQRKMPKLLGLNNSLHEDQEIYMGLCRGENLRSIKDESTLNCRLENKGNPYLILQPVKIEQKSWEPYLVQIHDLLTEGQVQTMREIAEPKLSRSLVQGDSGNEIVSLSRTSQNAWVGPTDHPVMERVYKLVEAVTGLSTDVSNEHAEIVQIANYGMGGHYTPHYDYLLVDKTQEELDQLHPREKVAGDRTATMMFYLSDVSRGGATVFPKIGASVWPRKGSAVFWYNLKKSGRENELTLHGACPVLHGSKWVANFWIRENGQTFRRKCDLNPDL